VAGHLASSTTELEILNQLWMYYLMRNVLKLLLFLTAFSLFLAACGNNAPPPLAAANEPTLVFIYTDG
jgi:hypothetical protein